jgi:hypothetical protein
MLCNLATLLHIIIRQIYIMILVDILHIFMNVKKISTSSTVFGIMLRQALSTCYCGIMLHQMKQLWLHLLLWYHDMSVVALVDFLLC